MGRDALVTEPVTDDDASLAVLTFSSAELWNSTGTVVTPCGRDQATKISAGREELAQIEDYARAVVVDIASTPTPSTGLVLVATELGRARQAARQPAR